MDLLGWQSRLHEHFKQLWLQRQNQAINAPVFALEHGLNTEEFQEIRFSLHAQIRKGQPNESHLLPWIVYATELGYGYEGDEYWQTFEHETPAWSTNGDRYWIKRAFVAFHKRYGGARPSGDWAEHFSIIAWPIHHAILPRYLQMHLAKLLYDTKYAITGKLLRDSRRLGEFLHRESAYSATRLHAFTEQTELAGRFASALLLHKTEQGTALLLPQTFERLVNDLERESRSRVWIKTAQDHACRTILSGLASSTGSGARDRAHDHGRQGREPVAGGKHVPPALKGRLVLVPRSDTEFELHLDLPDFAQLVPDYAHLEGLIANSRCMIAGTSGRPRPRGWLLDGPQTLVLQHLPKRDEPLLKFEDADVSLHQLFRTDELLLWEQPWVLKIGADGSACSMRSRSVRPGQNYVLLYNPEAKAPCSGMTQVHVNCAGVSAWRLSVPQPLTPESEQLLNRLRLNPWRTVHFWPAGLTAPQWDGEGFAEWLSTDPVWIGVRSDHDIRAVSFCLDEDPGSRLALRPTDPGQPVYVELPTLTLGAHRLSAVVTPLDESNGEQHGSLDIWIRRPRVKQLARKRLLALTVDPPTAGFQDVWENRVQVSVTGPFGIEATLSVHLLGPGQSEPLATAKFQVRLPVSPQDWKYQFEANVRGVRKFEDNCEDANRMRIGVEAPGVDKLVRAFERPIQPLRWKASSTLQSYSVQLISHFGEGVEPTVEYYPMESPDCSQPVAYLRAATGMAAPAPGLYCAAGLLAQSAVLVPKQVARIQDFAVALTFRKYPKSPESADGLLRIIERWHAARVLGDLPAFGHRRQVLEGLVGKLFDCIASEPIVVKVLAHASSEGNCRDGHLRFLIRSLKCASLAQGLIGEHGNCVEEGATKRLRAFRRVVMAKGCPGLSFKPSVEPLFEFALRLASAPETARNWRKAEFEPHLRELMRIPVLALAARIWVLLLAQRSRTPLGASALYAGWDWI